MHSKPKEHNTRFLSTRESVRRQLERSITIITRSLAESQTNTSDTKDLAVDGRACQLTELTVTPHILTHLAYVLRQWTLEHNTDTGQLRLR